METSSPAASSKADVPTFSGGVGFTQGQWSYNRDPLGFVNGPDGRLLAIAYGRGLSDREEVASMHANGYLIAAAPALYEALQHSLQFVIAWRLEYRDRADEHSRAQLKRVAVAAGKIEAALKKARGES